MLHITCSACYQPVNVPGDEAGRWVQCPQCHADNWVPSNLREGAPLPVQRVENTTTPDTSWLAIASIVFCVLCPPLAVVCGVVALWRINRSKGGLTGEVTAAVGIGLGTLFLFPGIPALVGVYHASNKMYSARNLRQLGIAMHNYHQDCGELPKAAIKSKDGRPLLSWRVEMLPYLGEEELYKQFHRDEPWDSPHNKTLLARMPKVFSNPRIKATTGMTHYQVFVGPGTLFDPAAPIRLGEVVAKDGTSNTLLIVEAAEPVPWTKPEDLKYDPEGAIPATWKKDRVFLVSFGDCSTREVRVTISEKKLRALITWTGGEKIDSADIH